MPSFSFGRHSEKVSVSLVDLAGAVERRPKRHDIGLIMVLKFVQ